MARRIVAAEVLAILVPVAGAAAYVAVNMRDAASVADADLLVERAPVADEANGFRDLDAAAALLWADDEDWDSVSEMLRGQSWDEALVDRLLADNRDAIARTERASRASGFATPPFRHIDDPLPDMLEWQRLARLVGLRAIREARSGDADASIETALTDLRLARLVISDREAVLIHAMIGLSIASIGTHAIATSLSYVGPTASQSLAWTTALEELRVDAGAWRDMWAGEYRMSKQLMVEAADGSTDEPIEESDSPVVDLLWKIVPDDYLFQKNGLLTLHAELIRSLRKVAGRPCAALEPVTDADEGSMRSLRQLLRPNAAGRVLAAIAAPNFRRFEFRRCALDTRIEATRAEIALRAYERETGSLPSTFDAMIPSYLAASPTDFFVGGPMRYDPDRRELRAAGVDLVHGGPCDDGSAMTEPCFRIPVRMEPADLARGHTSISEMN